MLLFKLRLLFGKLFGFGFLHYISSPDTLKPPLSSEEEASLAVLSASGERNARERLIEHNLRLVVYIAKKFDNTGINIEDLISIGTIGLIKAVNTFKADKSIKLATYGLLSILGDLLLILHKTTLYRCFVV